MPSNFDPIGFSIESAADLGEVWQKLHPTCEIIKLAHGEYQHWISESGAQIWIFVADGQLVTMSPAFSGQGRVRVNVQKTFPRDPFNAEGGLYGWANPGEKAGQKPETGDYPFVFDTPDFSLHGNLPLPVVRTAQITAFAHAAGVYKTEEEFLAAQPQEQKYASKSFIPIGLFTAAKTKEPPQAYAFLAGHVIATEMKTNEISGEKFVWACIDSLGGTYDVVAPTSMLSAAPNVGEILSGQFWMCGQLL